MFFFLPLGGSASHWELLPLLKSLIIGVFLGDLCSSLFSRSVWGWCTCTIQIEIQGVATQKLFAIKAWQILLHLKYFARNFIIAVLCSRGIEIHLTEFTWFSGSPVIYCDNKASVVNVMSPHVCQNRESRFNFSSQNVHCDIMFTADLEPVCVLDHSQINSSSRLSCCGKNKEWYETSRRLTVWCLW